jgi:hypothetical protein
MNSLSQSVFPHNRSNALTTLADLAASLRAGVLRFGVGG